MRSEPKVLLYEKTEIEKRLTDEKRKKQLSKSRGNVKLKTLRGLTQVGNLKKKIGKCD